MCPAMASHCIQERVLSRAAFVVKKSVQISLVGRRLLFRFFKPDEQPLLCLSIFKMQESRGRILSQIGDPSFHHRPFFAGDSPGRTLAFLIDHALDRL